MILFGVVLYRMNSTLNLSKLCIVDIDSLLITIDNDCFLEIVQPLEGKCFLKLYSTLAAWNGGLLTDFLSTRKSLLLIILNTSLSKPSKQKGKTLTFFCSGIQKRPDKTGVNGYVIRLIEKQKVDQLYITQITSEKLFNNPPLSFTHIWANFDTCARTII